MRYAAEANGPVRQAVVTRQDGKWVVDVDGRLFTVDDVPAGGHALSLLVSETTEAGLKAGTTGETTFSHDVTLAGDAPTGLLNVHVGSSIVPVALNGRRRS